MHVELLYFDDCPNWQVVNERLTQALDELGRSDVVLRVRVETLERAKELQFIGSPTVRIDGVDPFATGSEQVGLACRLYATPTGLSGSPTIAQLREVLT